MHIICVMGGEHPGVPWCECGGGGLSDEVLCNLLHGNEQTHFL